MHGYSAADRGHEATAEAVLTASRALVALAARSLADAAADVTLVQYRSLVVLAARGPQSMAALAEALSVTPPTASRLCDRLVRKGLVRRRGDTGDRRQVRVGLTAAGRQLVDDVTERRRAEIGRLLDAVSPEAQQAMLEGLRQLAEAAGEAPDTDWPEAWEL